MPKTINDYQQRWLAAMRPECIIAPWDEPLTATSCIISESSRSGLIAESRSYLADFGDAICFYRYLRIPEELDTTPAASDADETDWLPGLTEIQGSWQHYRARFGTVEMRRRRYEGERALDKLLGHFVRDGYRRGMQSKLIQVVNATLIDCALREVYVLPDDLAAVLARFGNPFAGYTIYTPEQPGTAVAVAFDLNAPGHREALAEHLMMTGQ